MSPGRDKTALSYWFPKLRRAGLPVPRTIIVPMPLDAQEGIFATFDGEGKNGPAIAAFLDQLRAAASVVGLPCFLRTDHASAKHSWEDSCFVRSADDIGGNVSQIVFFSECADLIGLPWSTWAVRELLPTIPLGVCPRYRNMPVCREFRFFVRDGQTICRHPYWPKAALDDGGAAIDYKALCRLDDEASLTALAEAAGTAVGGAWSVDLLETERGWFVTDMAEAEKSWHWPDCPQAGAAGTTP